MTALPRSTFAWRAAALAASTCLLATAALAALVLVVDLRADLDGAGDRARAAADRGLAVAGARAGPVVRAAAADGAGARVLDAQGRVVAAAGPVAPWRAQGASWYVRLATVGEGAWRPLARAVEASRGLPGGRRLVVREELPGGVGEIGPGTALWALGACCVLSLGGGAAAGRRAARRRREAAIVAAAAATIAAGSGRLPALPSGELGPVSGALLELRDRMAEVQAVADVHVDAVEAVLGPLASPASARTPAGREVRNPALEHLLDGLPPADRDAVSGALEELLAAGGRPSGKRVELGDGRVVDFDSWAVPGGRVVALTERTEQERLRRLRRQITGAAARQLRSPLAEIETIARDLFAHIPASSAPALRGLLGAVDRMNGLVTAMLRGTRHDARTAAVTRAPVGVAGLLWGLAERWDRALRPRALRVELDLAPDLPPVLTDAALAEEILTELIDNAAKFTPRGGTIRLVARPADTGAVALEVQDTGEGIARRDAPYVTQPFFRGARSEALPGAGLGLGVARALADRIGGRLVVHAGPGGRVALELPSAGTAELPALSVSAA
jgi:signal transduction histidine kinase